MDCRHVQDAILDSFDEAVTPRAMREAIAAHVAGCPACARFAARQQALDARLTAALVPSSPSPAFRQALRARIREEAPPLPGRAWAWSDMLPDIVHFASFGGATLLCALVLPVNPTVTAQAGSIAALLTYVLLATVRQSLEGAAQPEP